MSLCINILFFFFLSYYIHTQVQINFISNLSPSLYLRTLSPSSVYISNHMNHYLYNITSESIEETYLEGSPTSGNDFFPLLISSNNLPSFLIYYDRTFNKIVSYTIVISQLRIHQLFGISYLQQLITPLQFFMMMELIS